MKKLNNNGMTLIALVITIIALLILTSVSLNMILGENGIITKAEIAKEKTITQYLHAVKDVHF